MTDATIEAIGKIIAMLVPVAMAVIALYREMIKARIEADIAWAAKRKEEAIREGKPICPTGYRRKTNYYPWRRKYAGPTTETSPSAPSGDDSGRPGDSGSEGAIPGSPVQGEGVRSEGEAG